MKYILKLLTIFIPMVIFSPFVQAAQNVADYATSWQESEMSRARLVSSVNGTRGLREVVLGFHIQMSQGWKTYWRSPGDSGIAPVLKWEGSENLKSVEILWPQPEVFDLYGFSTRGYKKEIVFPLRIKLANPGKKIQVKLDITYGVCAEICIPLRQNFTLELPADDATASTSAALIEAFKERVPQPFGKASIVTQLSLTQISENTLRANLNSDVVFQKPVLIFESDDGDYFDIAEVKISPNGKQAEFFIKADLVKRSKKLKGRTITVTVIDRDRSAAGNVKVQ